MKKCSRNVQMIRGSFGKEILLIKSILKEGNHNAAGDDRNNTLSDK